MSARLDQRALGLLPDGERLSAHDAAVFNLREKRDQAGRAEPDFERLRGEAKARDGDLVEVGQRRHVGNFATGWLADLC